MMLNKRLIGVLAFSSLLLGACGTPKMFRLRHAEVDTSDGGRANGYVREVLERRGYELERASAGVVMTKWRYVVVNRWELDETWYGWQIRAEFDDDTVVLDAWCVQQLGDELARRYVWKRCKDANVSRIVGGSIDSLALGLGRL